MNACPMCHPDPGDERISNIALDALGAICVSERGDVESVSMLLDAVIRSGELPEFTVALVGIAGRILRIAGHEAGCGPDKVAGAVAASLREGA